MDGSLAVYLRRGTKLEECATLTDLTPDIVCKVRLANTGDSLITAVSRTPTQLLSSLHK